MEYEKEFIQEQQYLDKTCTFIRENLQREEQACSDEKEQIISARKEMWENVSRHIRRSNPSRRSPAGMTLPTSGSTTTGRRWILRTLQESTSPNMALSPPPPSASTSVCSPFRTKTPMNLTSTTSAHRLPACSTATKPVRWNIRHLPAPSVALYRSSGSLKLKKALSTTSSTPI